MSLDRGRSAGFYTAPPQLVIPAVLTTISSNPFNADNSICSEWARGLDIPRKRDTVLYTGCLYQLMAYSTPLVEIYSLLTPGLVAIAAEGLRRYPKAVSPLLRVFVARDESYYRYALDSLRSVALLLKRSGVDFGYLYEDDIYSGVYLHEIGFIEEFIEHAKRVYEVFKRNRVKRIITVDPHTTDVLKNIYPQYIEGFDLEVIHYSELVNEESIWKGSASGGGGPLYTVHDPCYIVRRLNLYRGIRALLKHVRVRDPPRSGENTFCCGGPIEGVSPELSISIAIERLRELKDTGASKVVVSCPICYLNLSRASRRLSADIEIIDLPQLLNRSGGELKK